MRLFIDPCPRLQTFSTGLEVLILIEEDRPPEVLIDEKVALPDRHLLLGLVQAMSIAVEEKDEESIVFGHESKIRLERDGTIKDVRPSLLIARSNDGSIGAFATVDQNVARRLARKAVRWFTGAIRLDVP